MAQSIEVSADKSAGVAAGGRASRRVSAPGRLESYAVVILLLLALAGFGLRVSQISRLGFAEDEINKLEAVRAYDRGEITPNAEHPMVMKTLIYLSMHAAKTWNASATVASQISDEAALRLPNLLVGALTVFPLFLLTAGLFDRRTALLAAALWAFGVNAITYNRIAKEDTLLVFFMLFAFYFYLRAKQTSGFDLPAKRRNYILSAISFGLMLASKYFPHYLGLNMLYFHLVRVREREPGEPRGNTPSVFYVTMCLAFLLANPAVLFPQTWQYLSAYSGEQLLTHHGYLMGGTLYDNVMSKTPFGGTPFYFYLLFLAIKTPLPLLLALFAGLLSIARRRKEPGAAFLILMFVLWIVPYSLVGAKWLRYSLSLMPFVYMIGAVGIMSMLRWCARSLRNNADAGAGADAGAITDADIAADAGANGGRRVGLLVGAASLVLFVALPAWAAYTHRPHYALYTNALAPTRAGYFFPHDEFYDDGLREAIEFVCRTAPPGAIIAHETPGVTRYYLEKFGRTDLRSRVLSDPAFSPFTEADRTYVILQRGRTYFENREKMEAVRASDKFSRAYEGLAGGVSAVEVYAPSADAR